MEPEELTFLLLLQTVDSEGFGSGFAFADSQSFTARLGIKSRSSPTAVRCRPTLVEVMTSDDLRQEPRTSELIALGMHSPSYT